MMLSDCTLVTVHTVVPAAGIEMQRYMRRGGQRSLALRMRDVPSIRKTQDRQLGTGALQTGTCHMWLLALVSFQNVACMHT